MDHRVQVPPAGPQVAAGLARGGMSPRGVGWLHAPQGGGTWPETNTAAVRSTAQVMGCHMLIRVIGVGLPPPTVSSKDTTRDKSVG